MRKTMLLMSFVIVTGLILSGCTNSSTIKPQAQTSNQPAATITFQNGTYQPNEVTIKQHQTIAFINQSDTDIWPASNIHPSHGIYPQFDPKKPVKPGQSWSFAFDRVGTWPFHDHIQPEFTGIITVE